MRHSQYTQRCPVNWQLKAYYGSLLPNLMIHYYYHLSFSIVQASITNYASITNAKIK
jgi:hypothetical protein